MINNPDCPVCHANSWREIGSRTYFRHHTDRAKGWQKAAYLTLFEEWCPDADRFTVHYQLCLDCGFVLYTPRPTPAEIEACYRIRRERTASEGRRVPVNPQRERLRAHRLYNIVAPHLHDVRKSCILDYGGDDGHLMERFVAAGATCHVLDYSGKAAPGVISIGKTEDELPANASYDAVICSHVVEHLVHPSQILAKLVSTLNPEGLMYIEVPVEIWRGPPIQSEPVTHLNFFTPTSLRRLVLEAGLHVQFSRFTSSPHPHGGWRMAASCIALKCSTSQRPRMISGIEEVEELLHPSISLRAWRRLLLARNIPHAAAQRLNRLTRQDKRP
jgi:SAM-dependent methyltransferase